MELTINGRKHQVDVPEDMRVLLRGPGWRLDADFVFDNGFRVVQLTPPGSPCSVQFGTKITSAAPGSAQGLSR